MIPELVALHLGAMHPYEKVLTLVLAFGPFVVLGTVIAVRRRHESDDEADRPREGVRRPGPDHRTGP